MAFESERTAANNARLNGFKAKQAQVQAGLGAGILGGFLNTPQAQGILGQQQNVFSGLMATGSIPAALQGAGYSTQSKAPAQGQVHGQGGRWVAVPGGDWTWFPDTPAVPKPAAPAPGPSAAPAVPPGGFATNLGNGLTYEQIVALLRDQNRQIMGT